MEYKFLREDHNRQDKTRKPDYKEGLAEESQRKSTPNHIASFHEIQAYKSELIERYRRSSFFIGTHIFCLGWTLEEFASSNKLEHHDPQTLKLYKQLKRASEIDFKAIIEGIRGGQISWGCNRKLEQQPEVAFKIRLSCDIVAPFRPDNDDLKAKPLFKRRV